MTLTATSVPRSGALLALASALLFGALTPLSKLLLSSLDPQLLAGLLYLGAGAGLALLRVLRAATGRPSPEAPLRRADLVIVMLSWVFVVTRFAHAGIFVTSNDVRTRSLAWFAGVLVVIAMWVYFALKILLA